MTCQSLMDARFTVLECIQQATQKLHSDSLLCSDHVGTPLRKTNTAAGVYFILSKLFVSLKLQLFSPLFTYWLFRPQKRKVNRRFHVRDICFSAVAFMSRTVKKR